MFIKENRVFPHFMLLLLDPITALKTVNPLCSVELHRHGSKAKVGEALGVETSNSQTLRFSSREEFRWPGTAGMNSHRIKPKAVGLTVVTALETKGLGFISDQVQTKETQLQGGTNWHCACFSPEHKQSICSCCP